MEDKLSECLEEIISVLQGKLIIGDHNSLNIFGSLEQQKMSETSKEIAKLFLKQGYDIEIVINDILEELIRFDISQQKKHRKIFLREKSSPQTVLLGQYNATLRFIDQLKIELTLQEAQILKETSLLNSLCERLNQSVEELQNCLKAGEATLALVKQKCVDNRLDFEENELWNRRLEQKINDLRMSQVVAEQSLEQIEMLLENNIRLEERIKVIITKAIPIWQQQMKDIIRVSNYLRQDQISRDFETELKFLAEVEHLDQSIRNDLKNIPT